MNLSKWLIVFFLSLFLIACRTTQPSQPIHLTHNQNLARQHASLVFKYLSHGYTDRAQENVKIALHLAPNDPVVLGTAGYYFEKTGDLKRANHYYFKAMQVTPTSGITKNNYGAFLCRNGRYKASIPYFEAAAKMKDTPITRQALQNAQYCYHKMQTKLGVRPT